jgi:hypothetical protein
MVYPSWQVKGSEKTEERINHFDWLQQKQTERGRSRRHICHDDKYLTRKIEDGTLENLKCVV